VNICSECTKYVCSDCHYTKVASIVSDISSDCHYTKVASIVSDISSDRHYTKVASIVSDISSDRHYIYGTVQMQCRHLTACLQMKKLLRGAATVLCSKVLLASCYDVYVKCSVFLYY